MWGYVVMAAMVLIGTVTALAATGAEQSARAEAATTFRKRIHPRAARRGRRVLGISRPQGRAGGVRLRVLFKFTDAFSGTMTAPFVIDLGFTRNDYAAIVKGVGLAATLIGGFAGGFVARRYSLATSLWMVASCRRSPTFRSPGLQWLASINGRWRSRSRRRILQRHRHRDLRRVSVCAVPEPLHTATQYALADALAAVGRTYLSSGAGYVAKAPDGAVLWRSASSWRSRA